MPYITEAQKETLKTGTPKNAGELNYCFTILALRYLKENGVNYQHFNDIVGALEGCKLELYRRKIAPYEDIKAEVNGDVYL